MSPARSHYPGDQHAEEDGKRLIEAADPKRLPRPQREPDSVPNPN
jgi:hypothetical protein